ncbi:This gene is cut off. It is continued from YAC YUP8H12R [Arabidopsis thaliana]|uniref:F9K20.1 protein n=1 Tax=Arabidopsis thaliana TaxID=3702 RepID=Q9ZVB2_ARATH|nr:This gene is cut off. It is continued from YAC YUP8H12R [Arabidopsis thaliana]
MGNAIGKASNDIGGFIGNIFTAPLKATLGRSCFLTNINRVNRRRKRLDDIEATTYDYPSDDESSSSDSPSRIDNIRPKQRRRRLGSKHSHHHHGSNRNNRRLIRLPSRQLSVRVGGKSRRVRRSTRKIKSRKIKTLKVKDVVD